ncbi:MAG: hypothetical protein R3A10_15185 [Caldilineaceae bacterium]
MPIIGARSHLRQLEAAAIFVMRGGDPVRASGAALLGRQGLHRHGASGLQGLWPGKFLPLMHIDTGQLPRNPDFGRSRGRAGAQLIVRYVQDSIDQGRAVEETGPTASRNGLQTITLLDALAESARGRLVAPVATRKRPAP